MVAEEGIRKRLEEIEYFDRQVAELGDSPTRGDVAELLKCYLGSDRRGVAGLALKVLHVAIQFERENLIAAMLDGMVEKKQIKEMQS